MADEWKDWELICKQEQAMRVRLEEQLVLRSKRVAELWSWWRPADERIQELEKQLQDYVNRCPRCSGRGKSHSVEHEHELVWEDCAKCAWARVALKVQ